MYSGKKIILYVVAVVIIVCVSYFTVPFVFNMLFGTHFSLTSWEVGDDDGFPGLSLGFSTTDTATVKLFGPSGSLLDSDLFFYGNHNTVFHLSSYKETVTSGQYKLYAYDKNNNKIFDKTLSFDGPNFSIISCSQKWWNRADWKIGYSLIGVTVEMHNNGDTPVYPHTVEITMDSESISGFVLPCVILPGESKYVDCFVYKDDAPENSTFTVSLKDSLACTLASGSFSVVLEDNVNVEEFNWSYKGRNRWLSIPYPEFLFDYYSGIDRIHHEDYASYVFDIYDDDYIDVLVDRLMRGFDNESDVNKINFAASFVQNLEYKKDSATNDSFEYPRYPVETLFNGDGGGDCEDKAILTAGILDQMGYDVALFRLPNHMAVGVHLDENVSDYEYYTENYYFLETTTAGKPLGFIPNGHKSRSDLEVYPISSRPLLIHNWKNNNLTIFTNTELGDFVKVIIIVENLGSGTAEDILVKGAFYTQNSLELNAENKVISSLKPGIKKEITIALDIPKSVTTRFKTRIYLEDDCVDEHESVSPFP
jgi:hypothetical protein